MTDTDIAIGATVSLRMPYMTKPDQTGKVVSVVLYFHGHKKYEVHGSKKGHEFITICSAEKLQESGDE